MHRLAHLAWLLLCLFAAPGLAAQGAPRIAVIIDDIGYHHERGLRAIRLPAAVTCAVIPLSPHGPRLAREAARLGREVIIHMPMSASNGQALDAGGIDISMAPELITARIDQAFALLPQAQGMNNHMGSLATSDPQTMEVVMTALASRQAFFIDSRTSAQSVAQAAARAHGLPNGGRDVFLDNQRDLMAINEQFNQLLRIARKRGSAIAIGHPYPETLEYLERVLPLMAQAGVEVVPVSRLLPRRPEAPRPAAAGEARAGADESAGGAVPLAADTHQAAGAQHEEAEREHQQAVDR